MRISTSELDRYRNALRALARQAATRVEAELEAVGYTTVAEAREVAIAAISDAVGAEGYAAQALAAKLFDEVCAAEGIDARSGELFEGLIDYDMLEDKVHWHARRLIEDDRSGFAASCSGLASFYTKRCAYENMQRNCNANDVRYARVPSGSETCPWCMMLASRGFVYHSKLTASHGMHQNCDCIIVPGRGGDNARDATQIEGYDPNKWYERWAGTGFAGAGSGSRVGDAARRYEPTMAAEDSMALQRRLLKGLSKADRGQAMDIILNANDVWANDRHDVEVHNHFAKRIQRAMIDNHITSADLAERVRGRHVSGASFGGYNEINDPDGRKRDAHAQRFYEEIRNRTASVECRRISEKTGIGEAVVRQAYEHVFINEHDLDGGRKRFDPDYEMAQSWQRLSTGKDIRPYDPTLIFHEAIESEYMEQGMSYDEAHGNTCQMGYDWFHDKQSWKRGQMIGGE